MRSSGRPLVIALAGVLGAAGLSVASAPAAVAAPPANDELSAAAPLAYGGAVHPTTTVEATTAPGEPLQPCSRLTRTVWFSFTAGASSGPVTLDTVSEDTTRDTVLALYTSSTVPATYGSLTRVGCNDDDRIGGTRLSRIDFTPTQGAVYYVQLGDYDGSSGTASGGPVGLRLRAQPVPVPRNDDLREPDLLDTGADATLGLNNTSATLEAGEELLQPACFGGAALQRTAWYLVSPSSDEPVTLTARGTTGGADPAIALWRLADGVGVEAAEPEDLTEAGCAMDGSATDPDAVVEVDGEANATYLVQLGDLGSGAGAMELEVDVPDYPTPANDDIGGAYPLVVDGLVAGTTAGATTRPDEPTQLFCDEIVSSVWFTYTAERDEVVGFDLVTSRPETYRWLSVFSGPPGDLAPAGCALDSNLFGTQTRARVEVTATAGTTYWVQVSDDADIAFTGPGPFRLRVQTLAVQPPPANDRIEGAAALPLPATGETVTLDVDNTFATNDDEVLLKTSCGVTMEQRPVWFSITTPVDRLLALETLGDRDTMMELWRGPAGADLDSLDNLGCADDQSGRNRNAALSYPLRAGVHYYLSVGTARGTRDAQGAGPFRLQVGEVEPLQPTATLLATTTGRDGRDVRLTAVIGPAGYVDGTVTFAEGDTVVAEDVPLTGPDTDRASVTLEDVELGPHDYTATFTPRGQFVLGAVAQAHLVVTLPSTTALTGSAAGRVVTLDASVAPAAAAGAVEFLDAGVVVGSAPLSAGSAQLVLPAATVGRHSYAARFVPAVDDTYAGSASAAVPVDVTAPPLVSLSGAATGPVTAGARAVTLTTVVAGIAGDPAPAGSIEWFEGGSSLGRTDLVGGAASLVLPAVGLGEHRYRAAYTPAGRAPYLAASSVDTLVVVAAPAQPAASATRLTAPGQVRRGARPRVVVSVVAGGAAAAGLVRFALDGRPVGVVPLVDGQAALRLPKVRRPVVLTVVYQGDAAAAPSVDTQRIRVRKRR